MRYLHQIPATLTIGIFFCVLTLRGMNQANGVICVGAGIAIGIIAGRLLVKSFHRQLFHGESTILSRSPPGGFLTIMLWTLVLSVIMVLCMWLLALIMTSLGIGGWSLLFLRLGAIASSALTTVFAIAGVYIYRIERRVGARVFLETDRLHFDDEDAGSS